MNEQKRLQILFFDNNSHCEPDVKRTQLTSNDLKRPQKPKTKNNLKGGSMQENFEINEHFLDEILSNDDI